MGLSAVPLYFYTCIYIRTSPRTWSMFDVTDSARGAPFVWSIYSKNRVTHNKIARRSEHRRPLIYIYIVTTALLSFAYVCLSPVLYVSPSLVCVHIYVTVFFHSLLIPFFLQQLVDTDLLIHHVNGLHHGT